MRAVYVFVGSSGECLGLAEERQGAVDGIGKGQAKKIPKTPRTPKVNQKMKLAHLVKLPCTSRKITMGTVAILTKLTFPVRMIA